MIKTDRVGEEEWIITLGGKGNDILCDVHQTRDGGYILVGCTESYRDGYYEDCWLIKICSEDHNSPIVCIFKPENGLYFNNKKIISLSSAIIISIIDVMCDAFDNETGVSSVEFFIDNKSKDCVENPPYLWNWDEMIFGKQKIKVIAHDWAGNVASDEIETWKFF